MRPKSLTSSLTSLQKLGIGAVTTFILISCGPTSFHSIGKYSVNNRTNNSTPEGGSADQTVNGTRLRINVEPESASIIKGARQTFQAMLYVNEESSVDISSRCEWAVSDNEIAAPVSTAKGSFDGRAVGSVLVAATCTEQGVTLRSDSTLVIRDLAIKALSITPQNPTVASGDLFALHAIATLEDQTTTDVSTLVSWSSSDEKLLSVSSASGSSGQALARKGGTVTVTATLRELNASTSVTITSAPDATVDLKANGIDGPLNVNPGAIVSLSWTSTFTTSCAIPGVGGASTLGQATIGPIVSDRSLTITCAAATGHGENPIDVVSIHLNSDVSPSATPTPTPSASATPSASPTTSATASPTASATPTPSASPSSTPEATTSPIPTETTTAVPTASAAPSQTNVPTDVPTSVPNVQPPPPPAPPLPPPPPPAVMGDIKANQQDGVVHVPYGSPAILSWTSFNTSKCRVLNNLNWEDVRANSSFSGTTPPVNINSTYELQCAGPATNESYTAVDTVTIQVDVPAPILNINSSWGNRPDKAQFWDGVNVSWNAMNVQPGSCTVSTQPNLSSGQPSVLYDLHSWTGNVRVGPTTFTMRCRTVDGRTSVEESALVDVCRLNETFVSGLGCVPWIPLHRCAVGSAPQVQHFYVPGPLSCPAGTAEESMAGGQSFAMTLPLMVGNTTLIGRVNGLQRMHHMYNNTTSDHYYSPGAPLNSAAHSYQPAYDFAAYEFSALEGFEPGFLGIIKEMFLWYAFKTSPILFEDHMYSLTASRTCIGSSDPKCGGEYVIYNGYQFQEIRSNNSRFYLLEFQIP